MLTKVSVDIHIYITCTFYIESYGKLKRFFYDSDLNKKKHRVFFTCEESIFILK